MDSHSLLGRVVVQHFLGAGKHAGMIVDVVGKRVVSVGVTLAHNGETWSYESTNLTHLSELDAEKPLPSAHVVLADSFDDLTALPAARHAKGLALAESASSNFRLAAAKAARTPSTSSGGVLAVGDGSYHVAAGLIALVTPTSKSGKCKFAYVHEIVEATCVSVHFADGDVAEMSNDEAIELIQPVDFDLEVATAKGDVEPVDGDGLRRWKNICEEAAKKKASYAKPVRVT